MSVKRFRGSREYQEEVASATSALKSGDYEKTFRICDGVRKAAGGDSPARVLYLGACALFGLGHVRQAEEWIAEHTVRDEERDLNLYLQAYLHLHKNRPDQALLCWTRILQIDPSATFADGLIEKLKSGGESLQRDLLRPMAFTKFLPLPGSGRSGVFPGEEPRRRYAEEIDEFDEPDRRAFRPERERTRYLPFLKKDRLLILTGASLAVLALIAGMAYLFLHARFVGEQNPFRRLVSQLPEPPARGTVIPEKELGDDRPLFLYKTGEDVVRDYELARRKIASGRVNQARFLTGKILHSNAGFEFRERARLLADFIPVVTRSEFMDPMAPEEIRKYPDLYRKSQVLWKGSMGSTVPGEKNRAFLFHPDHSEQEALLLPGRIPASTIEGSLRSGNRVEVFAFFTRMDEEDRLVLQIISLRPLSQDSREEE